MYTTYHLNSAQELTNELIEAIKATFTSKPITITISEELDETAYLLSNPANNAMLKQSLSQANNGRLIEINIGE